MIERFRLFVGQGVNHEDHGYGVIHKVGERTDRAVEVSFPTVGRIQVLIDTLDYASMSEVELEELQERFENNGHLTDTRKTRTLILVGNEREVGRMEAPALPRQNIPVPPSGLTPIVTTGNKCFHGNYIPYLSDDEDKAQSCSLCYPYKLLVKEDAEYLA